MIFKYSFIFFLFLVFSCGKSGGSSPSTGTQAEELSTGTYRVVLLPVNAGVAGNNAYGTAVINIENERLDIDVNMAHIPAGIKHFQSVHAGSKCPGKDSNGDKFIDILEGMNSYGKILIPLDSNLNSQESGLSYSPSSTSSGTYSYTEDADVSLMLSDLREVDENPNDHLVKLDLRDDLNLSTRTLVIYGVPASVNLPGTVSTINNESSEAYLPIACGTFVRVTDEEAK